ncbi:MAG: hypothetical protein K1Y36_06920 [Blastocatellia bacterium]|nr:hypothetical protein [Blastocatellia bacterium]
MGIRVHILRYGFLTMLALCLWWTGSSPALAGETPTGTECLPLHLTDSERNSIQTEDDPKDRVEKCLKIGLLRLAQAKEAIQNGDYSEADVSLETYNKLIQYAYGYTRSLNLKDKKKDGIYRTMETTLRRQLPLLECISRDCPDGASRYSQTTLSQVKGVRTQLLNYVFGADFIRAEAVNTNPSDNR